MNLDTLNLQAEFVAAALSPVDGARAVYRGLRIVGHRASVEERRMLWAIPGGEVRTTAWLQAHDPKFVVLERPTDAELCAMRELVCDDVLDPIQPADFDPEAE